MVLCILSITFQLANITIMLAKGMFQGLRDKRHARNTILDHSAKYSAFRQHIMPLAMSHSFVKTRCVSFRIGLLIPVATPGALARLRNTTADSPTFHAPSRIARSDSLSSISSLWLSVRLLHA